MLPTRSRCCRREADVADAKPVLPTLSRCCPQVDGYCPKLRINAAFLGLSV